MGNEIITVNNKDNALSALQDSIKMRLRYISVNFLKENVWPKVDFHLIFIERYINLDRRASLLYIIAKRSKTRFYKKHFYCTSSRSFFLFGESFANIESYSKNRTYRKLRHLEKGIYKRFWLRKLKVLTFTESDGK